jgi:hypothetical protein
MLSCFLFECIHNPLHLARKQYFFCPTYNIVYDIYMISYTILHKISYTISYIILDEMKLMLLLVQDCVCVVAPYPFRIEPLEEFDPIGDLDVTGGGDLWYARPLLFFTCTVCPTGHMGDGPSHKDVSLVFFSTFEPISLTPDSCMQRKGVPMLYEKGRLLRCHRSMSAQWKTSLDGCL